MIEGAWAIAKSKFKALKGVRLQQLEGCLAELMWRNQHRGNRAASVFETVKHVYTLTTPPTYSYTTPLFETWTAAYESGEDDYLDEAEDVQAPPCSNSEEEGENDEVIMTFCM